MAVGVKGLELEVLALGLESGDASSRSRCWGMIGTQRLRFRF